MPRDGSNGMLLLLLLRCSHAIIYLPANSINNIK